MADLDAELLALAGGGDSSDDEDTGPTLRDGKGSSSSPAANNTSPTNEVNSKTASKPTITVNGAPSKHMKKARNAESEEGEA